eukprot:43025-Eustigmatos_ZCMA.PRE.1
MSERHIRAEQQLETLQDARHHQVEQALRKERTGGEHDDGQLGSLQASLTPTCNIYAVYGKEGKPRHDLRPSIKAL